MSAACYDCGLGYGSPGWIEAIIPDKVWNRISPHKTDKQCGLLCINCISSRLAFMGIRGVPVWLCGIEPLIALEGDPSLDLKKLREWDITKD